MGAFFYRKCEFIEYKLNGEGISYKMLRAGGFCTW